VYTAYAHRFVEPKRRDYVAMFVHHIATIILVAGSHAVHFERIGMLVMYVHDASDITVDLLKMSNYLQLQNRAGYFVSETMFVVNLVLWIYYRLWTFPTHVLYSTFYESHLYAGIFGKNGDYWNNWEPFPFWKESNLLMFVLQVLHVYWTYIFIRLAIRIILLGAHNAGKDYEGGDKQKLNAKHH